MAYTDFRGLATVIQRGPAFRAAATGDLKVGDLVDQLFAQADATAGGGSAFYVSLENVASGNQGLFSEWAVISKPDTIAAGGVPTAGNHSGTLGDMLWLSTTAGAAVEVIDGDGIYQVVGSVISTQHVMLKPSHAMGDFFERCEKETTARTALVDDAGKAFVMTGLSDSVLTLPVTAVHGLYTIVNGSQAGDHLSSIDPVSADGIVGWDAGSVNDKGMLNTKATSRAGDYMQIRNSGLGDDLLVDNGRGVWAAES